MPASKVLQSLINEFEVEATESVPPQPTSQSELPIPTNEPPPKVQKHDSVVEA